MKLRAGVFLALLAICLVTAGEPVSGEGAVQLFLPVISRLIPPQRLGPNMGPGATAFAFDPQTPGVVYAGLFGAGVYKSTDGGMTWFPASRGLPDGALVQSLAIDPSNPARVYAGLYYNGDPAFASGVYRSEDGGRSWAATGRMDNPLAGIYSNHVVVYALSVSPDGSTIYAGTRTKGPTNPYGYGGVFKSTNYGDTWKLRNSGLPQNDLYVYDLALNPADPKMVFAGLHGSGVYRSDDGGVSWRSSNTGIPSNVVFTTANRSLALDRFSTNRILFATVGQVTYQSDDWGDNWKPSPSSNIFSFTADLNQADRVYGADLAGSVFFSDDFGVSWMPRAAGSTNGYLGADPLNAGVLLAGGSTAPVMRSLDGGRTFAASARGIGGYPVNGVVVDPANRARIVLSTFGQGVLYSGDGGLNWAPRNNGLPELNLVGLAGDPANNSILYVLTAVNGIYRSLDGGSSWLPFNAGFPQASSIPDEFYLPFRPIPPAEQLVGIPDNPIRATIVTNALAPALSAAVSPFSSNVILAGTAGKGVQRWNGSAWIPSSLTGGRVNTLLFDRGMPGRVWAGGDPTAGTFQVSNDDGQTWTALFNGMEGRTIFALAQFATDSSILLAGTDAGVYLSNDGGQHWTFTGPSAEPVRAVWLHPTRPGRILAATDWMVYAGSDWGGGWTLLDPVLENMGFLGMAAVPSSPTSLYFYTRYGGLILIEE